MFFETFIWKGDAIGAGVQGRADRRGRPGREGLRGVRRLRQPRGAAALLQAPAATSHVRRHPLIASPFRLLRNSGRDHRKLLVVDDAVGFVGGYNIGSLYATDWRDTHARLTGDIVWELQNAFIDYWNLYSSRPAARRCPTSAGTPGTPSIRVHRNIPRQPGLPDPRHVSRGASTAPRTTST